MGWKTRKDKLQSDQPEIEAAQDQEDQEREPEVETDTAAMARLAQLTADSEPSAFVLDLDKDAFRTDSKRTSLDPNEFGWFNNGQSETNGQHSPKFSAQRDSLDTRPASPSFATPQFDDTFSTPPTAPRFNEAPTIGSEEDDLADESSVKWSGPRARVEASEAPEPSFDLNSFAQPEKPVAATESEIDLTPSWAQPPATPSPTPAWAQDQEPSTPTPTWAQEPTPPAKAPQSAPEPAQPAWAQNNSEATPPPAFADPGDSLRPAGSTQNGRAAQPASQFPSPAAPPIAPAIEYMPQVGPFADPGPFGSPVNSAPPPAAPPPSTSPYPSAPRPQSPPYSSQPARPATDGQNINSFSRDSVAAGLVSAEGDFNIPKVAPFIVAGTHAQEEIAASGDHYLILRIRNLSSSYKLTKDVTTIGRPDSITKNYPDVEIELDDGVSRKHAEIRRKAGEFYVVDVGSTNGTLLNGDLMDVNVEMRLAHGDRIRVGEKTEIVFE